METKQIIVYKVVHIEGLVKGRKLSGFVWSERELVLEYKQDEVVTPAVGKCFAFDSLNNAKAWGWGDEIWEAETTKALRVRRRIFTNMHGIAYNIHDYWKGKVKGLSVAPRGTLLCPSLKLLERVAYKRGGACSWTDV